MNRGKHLRRESARARTLVSALVRHTVLLCVAYVVLRPVLLLAAASGKDLRQLVDPQITYLPIPFHLENLTRGFQVLGGTNSLVISLLCTSGLAAAQTLVCMIVAHGFTYSSFRGRGVLFVVMIVTFFIPQHVTFLPKYVQFSRYGLLGTFWTKLLPTLMGQGTRSALMILLFCQYYKQLPRSLQEATWIDGAGHFTTMTRVCIPLLIPAMVVCFIITFVWEWNDTYFSSTFFKGSIPMMTLKLQEARDAFFASSQGHAMESTDNYFHRGVQAATALAACSPLVMMYLLFERRLIASIDKTGITGE